MIKISPAKIDDANELSLFAKSTFIETFLADNTDDNIYRYCDTAFSPSIQSKEIQSASIITLLVEYDSLLIGYAQLYLRAAVDNLNAQLPSEIRRFYLKNTFHGQGIAQELMLHCLQVLQEHNSDKVWLGVWEHNPKAIRFYEKFGFTKIGGQDFYLGAEQQRDLIFARPV